MRPAHSRGHAEYRGDARPPLALIPVQAHEPPPLALIGPGVGAGPRDIREALLLS
jgi:hypothetical protein